MLKEVRNNTLFFDGCNTVELAKKYGTPLYLMSENDILEKIKEFKTCFTDRYENTRIAYAAKAFFPMAMSKIIEREGLYLDVVSGGELFTAKAADFPAERIEFDGNNKTLKEIEEAIDYDIGRFIVDGVEELHKINAVCKKKGKRARILYRITPGVKSDTHSYMITGTKDSKFGVPLNHSSIFPAIEAALNAECVDFLGFHYHMGSSIYDNAPYLSALEVTLSLIKEVRQRYGFQVKELNVDGGFGICYKENEPRKPFSYFLEPIMERIIRFSEEEKIERPAVIIEPGKSICGEAGITLYEVGNIKDIENIRKYVSVDGGMSDNIRTALYQAEYTGVIANKMDRAQDDLVTICGKCCESGDILIRDLRIPSPEPGDIFAVYTTGAYNYSMASHYNRHTVPAVVLLNDGRDELIVKRDTYDNLIKNDIIPLSLESGCRVYEEDINYD